MGYSLTDTVPKNIENLSQQLPSFDVQAEADRTRITALRDYLEFLSPANARQPTAAICRKALRW